MDMSDDAAGFRLALGQRIAEVVAKFSTKTAAAEIAGVTAEQLNKWIAGSVKVPVEGLWRLARGNMDDFSRLCAGPLEPEAIRPPRERPFQEDVMRDVLVALARVIASEGVTFAPERFADLAFDLHDYVADRRAQGVADADLPGIAHFITLAARGRQ